MVDNNKGFTLFDLLIAIVISIVLAVSAFRMYHTYVLRAQVSEAFAMFEVSKSIQMYRLAKGGGCTGSPATDESFIWGKYGSVTQNGTNVPVLTDNRATPVPTGCFFIYAFYTYYRGIGQLAIAKQLQGKSIQVDLYTDGSLRLSSATTVDPLYLPKSLY